MLPWGKVPEENLRKFFGESAAKFQQRPQRFGDTSTMGESPKTSAAVEWSQPEPRRQTVCAVGGRYFFFKLCPKPLALEICEAQMSDWEPHTIILGIALFYFDSAYALLFFSLRKL